MTAARAFCYLLEADGRTPRPEPDDSIWTDGMRALHEAGAHSVGRDVIGEMAVSTVFIGADLDAADPLPCLWESALFRHAGEGRLGQIIQVITRYASWEAADAGHRRLVDALQALPPAAQEEMLRALE